MNRPHTTVVLAMSADGKIADRARSAARFSSANDKAHLERQIALADGVLFGAGTLRAYGNTLPITNPQLLQQRQQQGKPPQPVHIVCSASGNLDPDWRFFRQNVPRWLLTTPEGAQRWQGQPQFDRILAAAIVSQSTREDGGGEAGERGSRGRGGRWGDEGEGGEGEEETEMRRKFNPKSFDWPAVLTQLAQLKIRKLAILGGGELVASLFAANLIDEIWLTVCPLILGGATAPTPVEGLGFLSQQARRLELLDAISIPGEIFLHYRVQC